MIKIKCKDCNFHNNCKLEKCNISQNNEEVNFISISRVFTFIIKWFIPIGFVKLFANDKIFTLDSIGKQTYYRISDNKKYKGADVLIRRS